MRDLLILLAVLAATCVGCDRGPAPSSGPDMPTPELIRPYAYPTLSEERHAEVCGDGSGGPTCESDEDCRICHDGSDCGVPVNLTELEARGAACQREDAAACEYAAVRCCSGGCRVTPY